MRVAQENEAKANEANRNLRIKNAEILATQAKMYLDDDDVFAAIETALDAMPQDGEEIPSNILAENVLTEATGLYNNNNKMLCNKLKLSGYVKFLEFSEDGNSILASDTVGTVYVINYDKNKVMQTYSPLETFGDTTGYIKDICVSGNNGYVLCNDQLLSINMADGSINWHYKNDNNQYLSLDKIVTNKNANTIFMSGYYSYIILDINGTVLSDFEKSNTEYNNSSFYTESFMAENNDVFVFNREKSVMYCINKDSFKIVPFNIKKENEILSFNENPSCIFINIGLDGSLIFDKAKMMCIDRNTFNVVWETEYTSKGVSSLYCNKIIEFEHVLSIKHDEYTDYERKDGVLAISGDEVLAFDKKTGELYYHNKTEYDDRILYCEKNTNSNSLRIATPNAFYPECYLVAAASGLSENDTFLLTGGYTFDQEREYIAHALPNRYALASDNASEISIYHNIAYDNYTLLKDFPERLKYVDRIADNKAGIVAAYTNEYIDNNTYKNTIAIYDTNNKSLLADFDVDIDVSEMRFVGDKLFVTDNHGTAGVYALNGGIIATANLEELFKESAGIDKEQYITMSFPYLATNQTSILYCCGNGIFVVDVSGETIKVNHMLVSSYLDNFCAKDDLISFIKDDYKTSTSKIAYFKTGDTKLSYVKENGTEKEFAKDSITSVVNAGEDGFVAFVSQEGYIGISDYGSESFKKIILNSGETVPLQITLSPDRKYIIALCSNGEVIKYSVETLAAVGKHQLSIDVDDNSELEFIDNSNFIVRKYSRSERIIIVNLDSMQLRADIEGVIHFMKNDKRILFKKYGDDAKYFYGYYDYKTGQELVEFAKSFLNRYSN